MDADFLTAAEAAWDAEDSGLGSQEYVPGQPTEAVVKAGEERATGTQEYHTVLQRQNTLAAYL